MPSILITGANRGLGLELARQYAEAGWRVHACCRDPAGAAALSRLADGGSARLAVHRMAVTEPATIKAVAATLRGEPIDVLFNNAGILGGALDDTRRLSFGGIDYAAWEEALRVNTLGPMRVAEAFVDHVAASERRLMAFMSTHMSSISELGEGGYYQYRSSKAALNLVVKALSIDLKPRGIRTLALHPGWVATDMGTAAAPLKPAASIKGVRQVIENYGRHETGKFYNYDGREFGW
jgi:NAD(P)-dependent dehydrogenase (short-subunit alcohol dehydrogenase family)